MTIKRKPRILLVDNEPRWSKSVQAVLEEQGQYYVGNVVDVDAALNLPHGNGFDLVIVNASLALGDSLPRFRELMRLYADKVLVISDVRSISTAIKVLKLGADYAVRPFEPRRIMDLVVSRLQPAYGAPG